ncbi:MAG: CBS domain-containing protein [Nanoarchaeota archaeon]|nr:CBS domain-containing protein [Nanoarchaeota archaeon]MBU4086257.1 CBS domain-containing protein [Nanoarchaeota archaeon]
MKSKIKVGDIMTRNFVSVSSSTNLIDCAKEMMKKRVGSLVLREGQKLVGLLTEKDIIWALTKTKNKNLDAIKAKDVASKKVAVIKPGADLYEALGRMKKLKFRRLPVVVNGSVIGMLTMKDILRIDPTLFADINFAEKIREESEKLKRMKTARWIKEGMCEECGNFNILYKVDERLLCEPCKEDM